MNSFIILISLNLVFFVSLFVFENIFFSVLLTTIATFIIFALLLHILPQLNILPKKNSAVKPFTLPVFFHNSNMYIYGIISLLFFIFLESILGIGFGPTVFATFFLFCYLNKFDSRASFFAAIIFFIFMTVLSRSTDIKPAEELSTYVYFFLIVGVIWQMIEFRYEKN